LVTVRLAALGALREADMPVNTEYQSTLGIVGLTSLSSLSVQGLTVTGSSQLLGSANLISASTVTVSTLLTVQKTASIASLSLTTFSFSILTGAAATSVPDNSLALIFRASGVSLVYMSGGTVYSVASSTVSGVA
jgi:hypothetical protein